MVKGLLGMVCFLFVGVASFAVAVSEHDAVIESVIEVIDQKSDAYNLSLNLIDAIETYNDQGLIPEEKQSLLYNFWKQLLEYIVQEHEGNKQFGEIDQIGDAYYYQDESGVYTELGCYGGMPCGLKKLVGLDLEGLEIISNNVIKNAQGQLFIRYRQVTQPGIDVGEFRQLAEQGGRGFFFTDNNNVYVSCGGKLLGGPFGSSRSGLCLTSLNPTSFVYHDDGNFATDGEVVYYGSSQVVGVVAENFEMLTFEKRLADKMYNVYSDGVTCFGVEVSIRTGYYLGGMIIIDNAFCE